MASFVIFNVFCLIFPVFYVLLGFTFCKKTEMICSWLVFIMHLREHCICELYQASAFVVQMPCICLCRIMYVYSHIFGHNASIHFMYNFAVNAPYIFNWSIYDLLAHLSTSHDLILSKWVCDFGLRYHLICILFWTEYHYLKGQFYCFHIIGIVSFHIDWHRFGNNVSNIKIICLLVACGLGQYV